MDNKYMELPALRKFYYNYEYKFNCVYIHTCSKKNNCTLLPQILMSWVGTLYIVCWNASIFLDLGYD